MAAFSRRRYLATGLSSLTALLAISSCSTPAPTSRTAVGASRPASANSAASATPAASGYHAPAQRCEGGHYPSRNVDIAAADGTRIAVVSLGSGPRGVLMLPEHEASACRWWPQATALAQAGFHVVLLDYRCTFFSGCPAHGNTWDLPSDAAAGIAELHAEGAEKVIVVGASAGGTLAVVAAAAAGPAVNGVVDLSGPADVSAMYDAPAETIDSFKAAAKITVPSLFAISKNDDSTSVIEVQNVYSQVPDTDKLLLVLPAEDGHGWDIVHDDGSADSVWHTLLEFLQAHD